MAVTCRRITTACALALVSLLALTSGGAVQPVFGAARAALLRGRGVSAAAQAGSNCAPPTLNRSAALAGGAITVSPIPGARDASHVTQISFLGVPAGDIAVASVAGSRSGGHSGKLLPYSQGDGASFQPDRPFVQGELVTVRALLHRGSEDVPFSWSFTVAQDDPISRSLETPPPALAPKPGDDQHFYSRPDLQPPSVSVSVSSGRQSLGRLLLAPYAGQGQYGPMILDNSGRLVWFQPLLPGERAADLRVQEYEGQPVLTWWQDPLPAGGRSDAGIVIADSSYRQLAIVRAGNGYKVDLHAFQIVPGNIGLLTIYSGIRCNLHAYRGPADGAVADTLVQEIDLKTGLVRFEWHSLDHVALGDSYMPMGWKENGSLKHPWDWFHINAVSPQPDGSMLVDSRNTWTAYEVNGRSGQVLWQLGGKHSSFAMGPGTRTAWQHDVRWQPNGTVTFFDNGATPKEHSQSRGVVLRLDLRHRRATFVQSFMHTPPLLTASQGDLQALSGGDWFVGWGQVPYFSEFAPNGKLVFDAHLPARFQSYTVFKFPWSGHPSEPPRIALRRAHGHTLLYASWNGATELSSWRVVGGAKGGQLTPIVGALRNGFETAVTLPGAPRYVAAQALDASGKVLGTSATLRL
jgi:hypothetical protein